MKADVSELERQLFSAYKTLRHAALQFDSQVSMAYDWAGMCPYWWNRSRPYCKREGSPALWPKRWWTDSYLGEVDIAYNAIRQYAISNCPDSEFRMWGRMCALVNPENWKSDRKRLADALYKIDEITEDADFLVMAFERIAGDIAICESKGESNGGNFSAAIRAVPLALFAAGVSESAYQVYAVLSEIKKRKATLKKQWIKRDSLEEVASRES